LSRSKKPNLLARKSLQHHVQCKQVPDTFSARLRHRGTEIPQTQQYHDSLEIIELYVQIHNHVVALCLQARQQLRQPHCRAAPKNKNSLSVNSFGPSLPPTCLFPPALPKLCLHALMINYVVINSCTAQLSSYQAEGTCSTAPPNACELTISTARDTLVKTHSFMHPVASAPPALTGLNVAPQIVR
jgi:hypothetical protein